MRAQDFFREDPHGLFENFKGLIDMFCSDVPWEIIKNAVHDVQFTGPDIIALVGYMVDLLAETGRILISVGPDVNHQALWVNAMKGHGLFVDVLLVVSSERTNRRRCASYMNRPHCTVLHNVWVMGRKKYTGAYHSPKGFGMFVLFFCVFVLLVLF